MIQFDLSLPRLIVEETTCTEIRPYLQIKPGHKRNRTMAEMYLVNLISKD